MISSMPDFLGGLILGALFGIGATGAMFAWLINRP